MFRKRKDANEETMAMGRVVGVRNASPAHRVAALQEREGASERIALTMQKSFRGMKGRAAKWYWEESAVQRGNQAPLRRRRDSFDRRAGPERIHKHANIKKGTRWVPFDKATTKKLEDAGSRVQIKFRGAPLDGVAVRSYSLVINAQAYSKHGPESGLHHVYVSATHVVDLKEMTQKNVKTGYSRRILREVVKLPGAEAEFMALVSQFSRDVAPLAKQLVGTLVTLLGILLKLGMKLVDVGRQLFNERTADMREAAAEKKQRALRAAAAKARATADALDAAARAG